jgi:hypothetical protein
MSNTTADATYAGANYDLSLFDRIAIAACAMNRCAFHVCNTERFHGEYLSAKLWGAGA